MIPWAIDNKIPPTSITLSLVNIHKMSEIPINNIVMPNESNLTVFQPFFVAKYQAIPKKTPGIDVTHSNVRNKSNNICMILTFLFD